jgi:hypothetical protein
METRFSISRVTIGDVRIVLSDLPVRQHAFVRELFGEKGRSFVKNDLFSKNGYEFF